VFAQANAGAPPEIPTARPQPPMENVFFNVLWGSLVGGMLVMGWSTLDDSVDSDQRYRFSRLSEQFLIGATYGGILGLITGVYLSIKGITFDENLSRIAHNPLNEPDRIQGQHFSLSGLKESRNRIHLVNLTLRF